MKTKSATLTPVQSIEIKKRKGIADLLTAMKGTGFQGRKLGEAYHTILQMMSDPTVTVFLGYAASLSVAGQSKIITWLMEQGLIDVLVATGANLSEDIVEAMGYSYYQCSPNSDDAALYEAGINRYYDVCGRESDYIEMTEEIAAFIEGLAASRPLSSRSFLRELGLRLLQKGMRSIVSVAAEMDIPVFCPAIADSPFGDAALIAESRGKPVAIDAMKGFSEFMSLSRDVDETGVIYIGGGVPKDFIQLFAVSSDLLNEVRCVPRNHNSRKRPLVKDISHPHKYAVQITTDSPQWGGLSGCTFDEAISWGKESPDGRHVQCYCDATIALPLVVHALSETMKKKRTPRRLGKCFPESGGSRRSRKTG